MKQLQKQYSAVTVFILWMMVTLPMGLIRFVLMPRIAAVKENPGIIYWVLMVAGMVWQFVLSMIILRLELGPLSWEKIKERIWLNPPRRKDGTTDRRLYLWVIPVILYGVLIEQTGFFSFIEEGVNRLVPAFTPPSYVQISSLAVPQYHGAWPLMVLALISCVFNYLLGEELFFRGILLPKMEGAFGKADWAVNGLLFAAYHVHKISEIPLFMIGSLFIALLNRRFRSFWPSVIIHGLEAIPLLASVVWVIWIM